MFKGKNKARIVYFVVFLTVLILEVLIALFVRDSFIRPYGGDILVTILICSFIRTVIPCGVDLLALWVFLFSTAVEIGQYFDFAKLIGLGDISFFRIILGSTFSVADIFCYAVGCALFLIIERILQKIKAL